MYDPTEESLTQEQINTIVNNDSQPFIPFDEPSNVVPEPFVPLAEPSNVVPTASADTTLYGDDDDMIESDDEEELLDDV